MSDFSKKASDLFMQGYSCSESVVKAAHETGIIDKNIDANILNKIVSPFSGAMGDHQCLCGAVAGAQMVLGLTRGRVGPADDPHQIKQLASEFNAKIKEKRGVKSLCCRVMRAGVDKDPAAQRENCRDIVQDSSEILENILFSVGSKI